MQKDPKEARTQERELRGDTGRRWGHLRAKEEASRGINIVDTLISDSSLQDCEKINFLLKAPGPGSC